MELAVKHPYYSSDCNYYSNEAGDAWETATAFLDEFEDTDIDMNQVFRWDVQKVDENLPGKYKAWVFVIHQRKGIYSPHYIQSITEDEEKRLRKYLERHWENLKLMWQPIS